MNPYQSPQPEAKPEPEPAAIPETTPKPIGFLKGTWYVARGALYTWGLWHIGCDIGVVVYKIIIYVQNLGMP